MKTFLFFVFLLLVVPMSVLNPMGRPAFLGYYTGVLATLMAMRFAGAGQASDTPKGVSFKEQQEVGSRYKSPQH
jgi:hypothetical protein